MIKENRGLISSESIASKLKKVENNLNKTDHVKSNIQPLLFINGKLNRKKHQYIAKNFALLGSLESQIKEYCKGVDLTILNYLINLGLDSIKQKDQFTAIDWSEIEDEIDKNVQ